MPKFNVQLSCAALCEALSIDDPSAGGCPHLPTDWIELEVEVDQDEVDYEAREPDPIRIEPDHRDLRDGLRELLRGDLSLASVLPIRAFDDVDATAQRIIEEELRAAGRKRAA